MSVSSGSGTLTASGSTSLSVNTSIAGLAPGGHTGHISFSPGQAIVTVTLNITSSVTPTPVVTPTHVVTPTTPQPTPVPQPIKAPEPTPVPAVLKPCVTAFPTYLPFVVTAQAGNPGSQVITLSNCGSAGTITLRSTNQWLTATGGGFVGAGANTAITIHAINTNQPGVYSGTITALITTRDGQVASVAIGVTLKVKGNQPPPQPTQPTVPTQSPVVPVVPTSNPAEEPTQTPG